MGRVAPTIVNGALDAESVVKTLNGRDAVVGADDHGPSRVAFLLSMAAAREIDKIGRGVVQIACR
jgi:hypothetical protein